MKKLIALLFVVLNFSCSELLHDSGLSDHKKSKEGSLILQIDELQHIFSQNPNIVGLKFNTVSYQNSIGIDLTVSAVNQELNGAQEGIYEEEHILTLENKKGTFKGLGHKSPNLKEFRFEFSELWNKIDYNGFILWKDQFNFIVETGAKELLVSGARLDLGMVGIMTGQFFTLKFEPIIDNNEIDQSPTGIEGLGIPFVQVAIPCFGKEFLNNAIWTSPVPSEEEQISSQGGLILKMKELQSIIESDPNLIGLKISSPNPEVLTNIDLELSPVYWKNIGERKTLLEGDERLNLEHKKGITITSNIISTDLNSFEPEFTYLRKNSKFSFALALEDQLELLNKITEEDLLVSGVKMDLGNQGITHGAFFTFKLEPLEETSSADNKISFKFFLNPSCPPVWF